MFLFTLKFLAVLLQFPETIATDIAPLEIKFGVKLTLIVFVPCPEMIFEPGGTVQLYVTPFINGVVYVLLSPGQTFIFPPLTLMLVGGSRKLLADTFNVVKLLVLSTQTLLAATEITPPLIPEVTLITLLVDAPVHPGGQVHM